MWGSGMRRTQSWVADCKCLSNGPDQEGANLLWCRLVCGVIYWYLWTVLIPRLRGYHLEEEGDVLQDGTSVTKLVKVKNP